MTCAWSGSLAELKNIHESGNLGNAIASTFDVVYQKHTDLNLLHGWNQSLALIVLSDTKFDDLQVIVELAMPVGGERADIVLLGGTKTNIVQSCLN